MEIALIRQWSEGRKVGAGVVDWDTVPEAHRAEVTQMRRGFPVRPQNPRCCAALPRSNRLGRVYFVRCMKKAKGGRWCRQHAGGKKPGSKRVEAAV